MQKKAAPIEILAPAGDAEMMRAAVFSGADCVYVGLSGFNARRGAGNFTEEALEEAVRFCHARGCKVYAALNTLVFPGRENAFAKALYAAARAGCDAVIVQDLAAATLARQYAPGLPLHASTQMSVHSLGGAQQLASLGFSRVILARELRFEEIAAIAASSPIEVEVFVHGALCLSVSGQCYFSAFLGGRSGNRGGCAGPCRLPFAPGERAPRSAAECGLSLKDLSILDALPELAEMGVASAKIEGRLRGPEYCAAVVDAALKARNGEYYDESFLQNIFSRSGFTRGWPEGQNGKGMFGRRREEDAAATKKALPAARELYRRERPRVAVSLRLQLAQSGAVLTVSDGCFEAEARLDRPLETAQKDPAAALEKALAKTGGTPFFPSGSTGIQIETGGFYLAAAEAAALRRQALDELLALREAQKPPYSQNLRLYQSATTSPAPKAVKRSPKLLRAWFRSASQLPREVETLCDELTLPLCEAQQVPQALRARTWLSLPRTLFGAEEAAARQQLEDAAALGFLGFEAQNIGQLPFCQKGSMAAAFGLNVTNQLAAATLFRLGCRSVTLSPELSLQQMRQLAGLLPLGETRLEALAYGHMPLVLTRACPLKTQNSCGSCAQNTHWTDRKGEVFPFSCEGETRTLYNPVPLWMGDRLEELPVDVAILYFTNETAEEAAKVLSAFQQGLPCEGRFTRGLYDRGTEP